MVDTTKKKLRQVTIIYWILLFYIIAALVWWLLSLEQQTQQMFELKKEALQIKYPSPTTEYHESLKKIEVQRRRDSTKYLSEGITFLVLIILGAGYIYRLVRKQFILQQQQQNFVMAITHELKTPIAISRLNLETLQRHRLDEPKREKILQMTLQETLRLDRMINNILISSQLEGSSYRLSKEELNFSDLAKDVVNDFAIRYPERKLESDIQPEIELEGDPLLLKLLLSNLLENANKYSPVNKAIVFKLKQTDNIVEVRVIDQGEGIIASEKEKVFKKFYRIGNEQTRKTQGTGLGLYLCKKIAKDHKGEILVEDNQPAGSIFITRFII